jgi:hypothetical protein
MISLAAVVAAAVLITAPLRSLADGDIGDSPPFLLQSHARSLVHGNMMQLRRQAVEAGGPHLQLSDKLVQDK